jgi:hypothetical protein
MPKRKSKYGAVKVQYDGHSFDSKMEYRRYCQLLLLAKSGQITDLKLQPKFPIIFHMKKVCNVIGDFEYMENDQWIVEDVKGMDNAVSRLKRKLVKLQYPSVDWRVIKEVSK